MKKSIFYSLPLLFIAIVAFSACGGGNKPAAESAEEIVIDTASADYFAYPLSEKYTQFTRNNRQTWGVLENGKVLFPDEYTNFELIYDDYFLVYKNIDGESKGAMANSKGKILKPFDMDCISYAVVVIDGKEYAEVKETGKTDYTYFDAETAEVFTPAPNAKIEHKEYDNPYD